MVVAALENHCLSSFGWDGSNLGARLKLTYEVHSLPRGHAVEQLQALQSIYGR